MEESKGYGLTEKKFNQQFLTAALDSNEDGYTNMRGYSISRSRETTTCSTATGGMISTYDGHHFHSPDDEYLKDALVNHEEVSAFPSRTNCEWEGSLQVSNRPGNHGFSGKEAHLATFNANNHLKKQSSIPAKLQNRQHSKQPDTDLLIKGDDLNILKDAFKLFDRNGDGFIDADELRAACIALGIQLNNALAEKILAGSQPDHLWNFSDFLKLATMIMPTQDEKAVIEEVFSLFDTGKKGYITLHDLKRGREACDAMDLYSDNDLEYMLAHADKSLTGRLTLQDFASIISKQPLFSP